MWCLLGGYKWKDENLEEAASRITVQRTGIEILFLKQVKAFSNTNRNQPSSIDLQKLFGLTQIKMDNFEWLDRPTVTIGFMPSLTS